MKKSILPLLVAFILIGSASASVLSSQDLYIANGYGGVSKIEAGSRNPVNIYPNIINGDSTSIAFNPNGDLFIGNGGNDTVAMIPHGTTNALNITPSGTWFPLGMTSDKNGNIYIANYNSGTVTKISSGSLYASDILYDQYACAGIAANSSGDLFIANYNFSTLQVLSHESGNLTSLNSSGLLNPIQMAFDNNENLFIANVGSPTIYQLIKGQSSVTPFVSFGSSAIGGIAIDNNNNIFFSQDNNIYVIEDGTTTPSLYGTSSILPMRLAFDPVPEPSTYALFGLGAIGMLILMQRKKNA